MSRFSPSHRLTFHRHVIAIGILALAAPYSALADSDWSAMAPTGTQDEICRDNTGRDKAGFTPTSMFLEGGNWGSSCTIRYQVADTFGAAATGVSRALSAGFVDNGDYASVAVRLYQFSRTDGAATIVGRVDSDAYAPAPGYRLRTSTPCVPLNFTNNSYMVEVELIRTVAPTLDLLGLPEIRYVGFSACPP